jgi:hypothetical protein
MKQDWNTISKLERSYRYLAEERINEDDKAYRMAFDRAREIIDTCRRAILLEGMNPFKRNI